MPPTNRRTPTRAERQADATCAELDQIFALLAGGPTVKDRNAHYAQLRRRIHAVIVRDNISAAVDGYKSRHGASDGGGNSEHTAVESAALRLVEGGMPSDIVHAKVTLIVANVRQVRDRMVGIDNGLRLIPAEPGAPTPEPAKCSHCLLEPGDRETDVNGALPGARFLGLWCIDQVQNRASAPNYGGRRDFLPNKAEIDAWQSGRKPRVHVDPKDPAWKWADGSTTGATLNPPPSAA